MVLLVALATATSLAVAAFAVALALRQRATAEELRALRAELAEATERLGAVERCANDAAARAEAAGTLLLEKGVADEAELEAARRRQDHGEPNAPDSTAEPSMPGRGSRTVH